MKSRTKWLCLDCKVDTGKIGEHYFINTDLWLQATNSVKGMLCIGCLEIRLKRKLSREDFTDAYINKTGIRSKRFIERLNYTSEATAA